MASESQPAWTVEQGTPLLVGVHCSACGADAFPPQSYGCTSCGAFGAALAPRSLAASGRLVSYALVRTHATHAVPFLLADVALDAGPVVRAQLADTTTIALDQRVRGIVVDDEQGSHIEFLEQESP